MLLGCIATPIQKEKTRKNNKEKHVMRVVSKTFFLENELNVQSILTNYPQYFYLFFESEKIDYNELNDKSLVPLLLEKTDQYLLHYENKLLYSLEDIFSFLENETPFKYLLFWIQCYQHLLKSLTILNDNHIVNFISEEGIGINENNQPLLINFENSFITNTSDSSENIKRLLPYMNNLWPTEFHILFHLHKKDVTALSKIQLENILSELLVSDKTTLSYFHQYVNQSLQKLVVHLLNKTWLTWNLYMVNQIFLLYLTKMDQTNILTKGLKELLLEGCCPNPKKRLSVEETEYRLQRLLYESERNVFTEIKFNVS